MEPDVSEEVCGQQDEAITEIGQVRVNAVSPGVPECLHLLRLTGDVVTVAIPHIPTRGGPLEV